MAESAQSADKSDIQEISLHIDGQVFIAKKDVLCEHSDYFRAMFSGNYVENEKQDITIDVVDAVSMEIILKYMNLGLTDLSEYTLTTVGKLAMASNFLQVTQLIIQIKYWLDLQLSLENWVEIMTIAEHASYTKLEKLSGAFGLHSFKEMKPEYIPTLEKLFWYLSHPSLNADSEADIFKFGYKWILHPETCYCADILMVVVGCLDITKVNNQDLKEISLLMTDCDNSLAAKVIECMKMLIDNKYSLQLDVLKENRNNLFETFSESVYNEVYNIVKYSTKRQMLFTPVVAVWKYKNGTLEFTNHELYTLTSRRFGMWLDVADKTLWGWNLAVWGVNKLVIVCGEYGRGTGQFMKDVKVYDTLRHHWTYHGVQLPARRHAGVTVAGDLLFIVGGVGEFRIMKGAAMIYNLKERTVRRIENFPDAIQSPAICTHYGNVYASGHTTIYKYEDLEEKNKWRMSVVADIRTSKMVSFQEYIYCSQNYFSHLYRYRPGIDRKLEMVTQFSAPPAAYCNLGRSLIVFTRPMCGQVETMKIEEFVKPCQCKDGVCLPEARCIPRVVWSDANCNITINDVAGACPLVMQMPKIKIKVSEYHQKYINRYANVTYEKTEN